MLMAMIEMRQEDEGEEDEEEEEEDEERRRRRRRQRLTEEIRGQTKADGRECPTCLPSTTPAPPSQASDSTATANSTYKTPPSSSPRSIVFSAFCIETPQELSLCACLIPTPHA